MEATVDIPQPLRARVTEVGREVLPEDVDTWRRLREIEDKSLKVRTILQAWERQHKEERALRRTYAKYLLVALFVQVAFVNMFLIALGMGWFKVEQWVANIFVVSVFGEIAGCALIVVKYLFPKVGTELFSILEKL